MSPREPALPSHLPFRRHRILGYWQKKSRLSHRAHARHRRTGTTGTTPPVIRSTLIRPLTHTARVRSIRRPANTCQHVLGPSTLPAKRLHCGPFLPDTATPVSHPHEATEIGTHLGLTRRKGSLPARQRHATVQHRSAAPWRPVRHMTDPAAETPDGGEWSKPAVKSLPDTSFLRSDLLACNHSAWMRTIMGIRPSSWHSTDGVTPVKEKNRKKTKKVLTPARTTFLPRVRGARAAAGFPSRATIPGTPSQSGNLRCRSIVSIIGSVSYTHLTLPTN